MHQRPGETYQEDEEQRRPWKGGAAMVKEFDCSLVWRAQALEECKWKSITVGLSYLPVSLSRRSNSLVLPLLGSHKKKNRATALPSALKIRAKQTCSAPRIQHYQRMMLVCFLPIGSTSRKHPKYLHKLEVEILF